MKQLVQQAVFDGYGANAGMAVERAKELVI
jgi:hypothetical protein